MDGSAASRRDGDPVVVSATIQEFAGERFYLCGRYFQRKGRRLHVAVWESAHGPVPPGHHVHHRSGRDHNGLSDLECLTAREHLGVRHGADAGERGRRTIRKAAERAREWHGSPAGRERHRQQYELHCAPALTAREQRRCDHCDREFSAARTSKYCSANCRAAARRKSGIDNEHRACTACGGAFVANRYSRQRTCSAECGWAVRRRMAAVPVGDARGA